METAKGVYQWPALGRVLPDAIAFVIGLGAAWMLGWRTTELVWSLWLCSLVLGYLTILSTIGGGIYIGIHALEHEEFPKEKRPAAIVGGAVVALFFLVFFSLHFCGFHAGHAVFLSSFFPVKELPKSAFFNAFMNPLLLWKTVFQYLLLPYGMFLIPAIIAERRTVFASFTEAVRMARRENIWHDFRDFLQSEQGRRKMLRDPFAGPYLNVIRMHLLIFFFAFCHMLNVESFLVYVVVYSVYFFPWRAFHATGEAPT